MSLSPTLCAYVLLIFYPVRGEQTGRQGKATLTLLLHVDACCGVYYPGVCVAKNKNQRPRRRQSAAGAASGKIIACTRNTWLFRQVFAISFVALPPLITLYDSNGKSSTTITTFVLLRQYLFHAKI